MAPPGGPRPGWSRRAQYGLFFSLLAAILGLLVGLILLGLSLAAPKSYASVRGAALDATAPATGAMHGVTATIAGVFTGAGSYWDAASQNGQLKAERRLMLQRIVEARAVLLENRELKSALQLRERSDRTVATGRIVGSSFSSPRRYAILSAGGSDGVRIGMPVRSADGLIGRVIDSGALASRVLLVSDRASVIPTKLLRTGQPVISQGRGDGTVDLRPLEVGRNPFQKGDIVITSGTGGLYPPLVPVARVIRLEDDGAIAIPVADPGRTSFALVQPPYEPAAVAEEAADASAEAP